LAYREAEADATSGLGCDKPEAVALGKRTVLKSCWRQEVFALSAIFGDLQRFMPFRERKHTSCAPKRKNPCRQSDTSCIDLSAPPEQAVRGTLAHSSLNFGHQSLRKPLLLPTQPYELQARGIRDVFNYRAKL
jgi:hypothetical protein